MAKYAYKGATPTQSSSANAGVFSVSDVTELLNNDEMSVPSFDVQYLVIGGGAGGGGPAGSASGTGGGGAGGYRNSFASENSGNNIPTEAVLKLPLNTDITVTVGAGGSSNTDGNDSVVYTITSLGGGRGGNGGGNRAYLGLVGSGGGAGSYVGSLSYGKQGSVEQGTIGGYSKGGNTNNIRAGGGGGGAGQNGENGQDYDAGVGGNGLTSSITGSAVTRAGGGGGAGPNSGNSRAGGSGGGGSSVNNGSTAASGTVNTGSGGGSATGSGGIPGSGGSGVVILRWATADATIGATRTGLTDGGVQTDGSDSYIVFTAGTGTVTFS